MRISHSGAFCVFLTVALATSISAEERKLELRLTAAELWQQSHVTNVRMSADGKAIELTRGLLIENDGAAAGYSYQPNEEILGEGMTAYQRLRVPALQGHVHSDQDEKPKHAPRAYLLVGHTGKKLQATINGKEVPLPEPTQAGRYWKQFQIPPTSLTPDSQNEIGLSGDGKLWIARADERARWPHEDKPHVQQSHKIIKATPTGSPKSLGPKNDIAGEYYVRLYLDGFLQEGTLETTTYDAANLSGDAIPPAKIRVQSIHIQAEFADKRASPQVGLIWATNPERTEFQGRLSSESEIKLSALNDESLPRFFSVYVTLPMVEPEVTPRLTAIRIRTEIAAEPSWSDKLKITGKQIPKLVYPEEWFHFEKLDHARLADFRKQFALDEVVKGCTTDLQRMEKLAVWTSQQWTKGHLGKIYPKWDAFEILKKHDDGTPIGGFCQQYNLVFLQACESFGMVGRCVSIGSGDHGITIRSGHEVVEVWSNELNKWVYVDGQAAWYFVDKETRTPLSLLELRERQVAAFQEKTHRAVDVVVLAKSPYEWKGLGEWPAFAELRMIPHTQFLDGKLPLPLNQGMRGWFWTGHRAWTEDTYPASVLYSDRVTNAHDWNWPINQTQLWLEQQAKPGELEVRLAHNMPSFAKYRVQIDDQPARNGDNGVFTWPLRAGENRLQVRAVNNLGLAGPTSWIKVEYKP